MKERRLTPWSLLKDPKFVSAMMALAYTLFTLTGLIIIFAPPDEVVSRTWVLVGYLVGGFFIIGGLLGTLSLHGGEWWIERAGLMFEVGAMLGYVFTLWSLNDNSTTEVHVRTSLSFVVISLLAMRFYKIRGLTLDPTK